MIVVDSPEASSRRESAPDVSGESPQISDRESLDSVMDASLDAISIDGVDELPAPPLSGRGGRTGFRVSVQVNPPSQATQPGSVGDSISNKGLEFSPLPRSHSIFWSEPDDNEMCLFSSEV